MHKKYGFYDWEKYDEDNTVIRIVASWATQEKFVDWFLEDVKKLRKEKMGIDDDDEDVEWVYLEKEEEETVGTYEKENTMAQK